MREHNGHDAVRLQYPVTLGEDQAHSFLVILEGEGGGTTLTGEFRRTSDCFILLVGQLPSEQSGKYAPGRPLEPDVEEV